MLAAARVSQMCRNHCVCCVWRPGRVGLCVTRHGSMAIRPPSDVSKPWCAWRLVARGVLDLKSDVDPKRRNHCVCASRRFLPRCSNASMATCWTPSVETLVCVCVCVCNVWLPMRSNRVGHLCGNHCVCNVWQLGRSHVTRDGTVPPGGIQIEVDLVVDTRCIFNIKGSPIWSSAFLSRALLLEF